MGEAVINWLGWLQEFLRITRIWNYCPYIKFMERRNFLKSLLATGAMSFIPSVPAFAGRAGIVRPLHEYQSPYSGAAFIARTRSGITPKLLSDQMGISADMAQKTVDVLRHEGVLSAPNPLGISRAFRSIGGSDGRANYVNLRKKLKRFKEMMLEEEEQIAQIENCNTDNEEEVSEIPENSQISKNDYET